MSDDAMHELREEVEAWRANHREAWMTLRALREVIEQHAPPGAMIAEEHIGPTFGEMGEQLAHGVLAIVDRAHRAERELRFANLAVLTLTDDDLEDLNRSFRRSLPYALLPLAAALGGGLVWLAHFMGWIQ